MCTWSLQSFLHFPGECRYNRKEPRSHKFSPDNRVCIFQPWIERVTAYSSTRFTKNKLYITAKTNFLGSNLLWVSTTITIGFQFNMTSTCLIRRCARGFAAVTSIPAADCGVDTRSSLVIGANIFVICEERGPLAIISSTFALGR